MRISIGSDHGGFDQKQPIVDHLKSKGYGVIDRGPSSSDSVDYPDYAALVAEDVAVKEADFGILICGTGIGMAIAANKLRGIRAANVIRPDFAKLAREHNNANVITLSGRFVSVEDNIEIVDAFLETPFGGEGSERHGRRVEKIMALEG